LHCEHWGLISQLSDANLQADPFIDVMNNTLVRRFCRGVSFRGLRLVTESAIVYVDDTSCATELVQRLAHLGVL
jgi:hypothetical protein